MIRRETRGSVNPQSSAINEQFVKKEQSCLNAWTGKETAEKVTDGSAASREISIPDQCLRKVEQPKYTSRERCVNILIPGLEKARAIVASSTARVVKRNNICWRDWKSYRV